MRKVKARLQVEDTTAHLTHSTQLAVQGQTVCDFEGKEAEAWTSVVLSLSERIFKFALNSTTDTLPHNKNFSIFFNQSINQFIESFISYAGGHPGTGQRLTLCVVVAVLA